MLKFGNKRFFKSLSAFIADWLKKEIEEGRIKKNEQKQYQGQEYFEIE